MSGSADAAMPLRGRRIVVTRPRGRSDELSDRLRRHGAEVVQAPLIRIIAPTEPRALQSAVKRIRDFDWIILTSVNGVDRFLGAVQDAGLTVDTFDRCRLCAVGPATAAALGRAGREVDLVPERYTADSIVDAISVKCSLAGLRILLPRAEAANASVPDRLRALGAEVEDVPAYRTVADLRGAQTLRGWIERGGVDLVTFTSGSTVRSFHDHVAADPGRALVAVIGPVTAAVARAAGWKVAVEAKPYTTSGMIEAIVALFHGHPPSDRVG